MPNLHDVERRIKSVKSTRQITSTMQMVAAAKVPRSSKQLEKSMPYTRGIAKILKAVSSGETDVVIDLLQEHEEVKNVLVIAIVSDKGLAGGFNSNILKLAQQVIDGYQSKGINTEIVACGKKAKVYFDFRDMPLKMEYVGASEAPGFEIAEEVVEYAIESYLEGKIDRVEVVRNKCKNSMEQTVEHDVLLPIEASALSGDSGEDHETSADEGNDKADDGSEENSSKYLDEFVFEPDTESVLQSLIPTYLRTTLFNMLLDSACGEQVARRVAMQAATDSANEMVDSLTMLYNTVRQGAITTEITEIVGGAEALKE